MQWHMAMIIMTALTFGNSLLLKGSFKDLNASHPSSIGVADLRERCDCRSISYLFFVEVFKLERR